LKLNKKEKKFVLCLRREGRSGKAKSGEKALSLRRERRRPSGYRRGEAVFSVPMTHGKGVRPSILTERNGKGFDKSAP